MKKLLLALLSGVILACSWPTYGFPGLLFFAFVPLLYLERSLRLSERKRKALSFFGYAYLGFFIWNIVTSYWIYFATPFGMWFAVLANTLLMTLVFLIYHFIAKKIKFGAASTFLVVLWICFEKMHLIWEFSWPWLNLGNAFAEYTSWIQWYEFTGTFGGTLWVWLVNISIFRTVLLFEKYREKGIIYRSLLKNGLLIGIPILISLFILNQYSADGKKIEVVILQPNIDPYTEKYNTTDERIGALLNDLARTSVDGNTDLVIAPETVYADGTDLHQFSNSPANYYTQELLIGNPGLDFLGGISMIYVFADPSKISSQTNQARPGLWYNDYNSAFFIGAERDSVQLYHKSKLVVGVENFPYKELLQPLLGDAMIDLGGTVSTKTTQPDREVFTLSNGAKVGPIICYESVYGEYDTGYVQNGANFLAIITNDAWWGNTQGHQQHLAYASLRAIETRRDIARSANTGISAFINQTGKVTAQLGYGKQGSLKGMVQLNSDQTFYVRFGDYIARISLFLAGFIFLFAVTRRRKA